MDYRLENDALSVTVSTHGGQLVSVRRKRGSVEHIWRGDPAVWKFQAPVLFPYTGRLKDNMAVIRGKTIENAPPHGVARLMEHHLLRQTADTVTLAADSDEESMKIFPYRFRFCATFRLEGQRLYHTLTVENTDDAPFAFGIGFHPGFAVPFDEYHTIGDYELRFSAPQSPRCLETPEGLVSGKSFLLGDHMTALPLADGLFDGGGWCMAGLDCETVGLYEKDSGRGVSCRVAGFPYCLLWSQPGRPQFVCIEPWHSLPDKKDATGLWEDKAPAAVLSPSQRWETTLEMDFFG